MKVFTGLWAAHSRSLEAMLVWVMRTSVCPGAEDLMTFLLNVLHSNCPAGQGGETDYLLPTSRIYFECHYGVRRVYVLTSWLPIRFKLYPSTANWVPGLISWVALVCVGPYLFCVTRVHRLIFWLIVKCQVLSTAFK